jgi:hypothetical protein
MTTTTVSTSRLEKPASPELCTRDESATALLKLCGTFVPPLSGYNGVLESAVSWPVHFSASRDVSALKSFAMTALLSRT